MLETADILAMAHRQVIDTDQLELVQTREKQIYGSWQCAIYRYRRVPGTVLEDTGLLVYNFAQDTPNGRHLDLKFCISGNCYCSLKGEDCDKCADDTSGECDTKLATIDLLHFRFEPVHVAGLAKGYRKSLTEELLNFRFQESFSRVVTVSPKVRITLEALLNNGYTDTLENIFINAQTQILLLYSLETLAGNKEEEQEIPACKFLANEADRQKIVKAREILLDHIGAPITIKELSRKVAINECYLKKGFKVLFGSTIFDFYQEQRMEHAKFLLYKKGKTVSEVSSLLGYSSISHFSTAFKKHTGLKPCELLVR